MKLTYIANARIPTEKAHGIQIMKMCEAFSNAQVKTELVVPRRRNLIKDDPFRYYNVQQTFNITTLPSLDPYWLIKLPQGIYIKFQALFFISKLRGFLNKVKKEDVLYTREEYLLSVLHKAGSKVVWETHNLPRNTDRYLSSWKKCHRIVAITEGLKKDLVSLGVPDSKVIVASDGVELDKFKIQNSKFKIRQQLNLPQDNFIAMYTGHLYDWKGAALLLETAKNFQFPSLRQGFGGQEISNFQTTFVFVGGTDDDVAKYREMARGLDNVLILGHKPYAEIPKYLAAADVLVLPNSAKQKISRKYTSPMKLFEYMAAAKPIVASDLPSIREILDDQNSVLVHPDDPKALTEGIEKVGKDAKLARQISELAAQKVQEYTWQGRADKILTTITPN